MSLEYIGSFELIGGVKKLFPRPFAFLVETQLRTIYNITLAVI